MLLGGFGDFAAARLHGDGRDTPPRRCVSFATHMCLSAFALCCVLCDGVGGMMLCVGPAASSDNIEERFSALQNFLKAQKVDNI